MARLHCDRFNFMNSFIVLKRAQLVVIDLSSGAADQHFGGGGLDWKNRNCRDVDSAEMGTKAHHLQKEEGLKPLVPPPDSTPITLQDGKNFVISISC